MSTYRTILGIDEAGLGPILGPMTVGYAGFSLPIDMRADALLGVNLWEVLGVSNAPADRKKRPVVCDSKKLYSPSKGVSALEEEVLGWATVAAHDVQNWASFLRAHCPMLREDTAAYEWYAAAPDPFPLCVSGDRSRLRAVALQNALESANCTLEAFGVVPVLEGELNRMMKRLGNKSRAEFDVISRVIGHFWQKHHNLAVVCDRQGGRTRYARTLAANFPEAQIQIFIEEKEISTYELTIPEVDGVPSLFIAFMEKGDRDHLPIALASMGAKYIREVMMHQFNAWFHNYDADLKPTAGYYKDGRRWLEESAELRRKIGVDDARIIRNR